MRGGGGGGGEDGGGGGEAGEEDECSGSASEPPGQRGKQNKQENGVPVPLRSGVSVAELYTVPALAAVWDQHVSRGGLGTCPTCQ